MRLFTLFILVMLLFGSLNAQTISYKYDNLNRVISVVYPDSSIIQYTYDASGNRSSLRITNICFVKQPPVISTDKAPVFCGGDSIVLTSSASAQYTWSTGDTSQKIVVKRSGRYAVTAKYSSSCSKISDSITINVRPSPVARINPVKDTSVICSGDSLTMQADTSSFYSYQWYRAGVIVSTASSLVAKTANLYKLRVTSVNGCVDSATRQVTVHALPTVNAGIDQTICARSSISIGGLPVAAYTYNWTPNTLLNDSTISSPVATPEVTTTYILKVTDTFRCISRDTMIVTVKPSPVAKITAPGDIILCSGDSAIIKADTSATYRYQWPGGSTSSFIYVKNAGVYQLKVTSTNGCIDSAKTKVIVNPLPVFTMGKDQTICSGSSVLIGPIAAGEDVFSWQPINGLSNPNVANPIASPPTTTLYSLKVTNLFQCSASASLTVNVKPSPVARITISGSSAICPGDSVALNATTTSGYTYLWSTGLLSSSIFAKKAGVYQLKVTASNGCTDSATQAITLKPLPDAIAGSDKSICFLDSIPIGSITNAPYQCSWLPVTGLNNPTSPNPVAKPLTSTAYFLTAINTQGCSITKQVSVTVNSLPMANAGADIVINTGKSTTIGGKPSATGNAPFSYLWQPATYLSPDATAANPVANPTTTIRYQLLITDKNSCKDSAHVLVAVIPLQAKYHAYLTASNTLVVIGSNISDGAHFVGVIDMKGKSVITEKQVPISNSSLFYQTPINHLPAGAYIVYIYDSSNTDQSISIQIIKGK